ncbi:MAG TPA: ABC transporter ATP-binding protein [Devosiaceae bacterium]|jgi:ABC-type Fe3+/spermidine/putrescine transport system ATPase subunit
MNTNSIDLQSGSARVASGDTNTPLAVRIAGLNKVYGNSVTAIKDISLDVPEGHLVVLLGPSGCGKTTLLRCIAGLERPNAGEIAIGNTTVFSGNVFVQPERRGLGMMFQSYALWPHMTVFNNIAYPLSSGTGMSKEEIRAAVAKQMRKMGIEGLDARYPSQLSGGQQQRVALARALVREPSVLLFDEPLSNVDAKVRRRLRLELREIKKATGFSGVYVTHDQEEAMELADTLVVMENGMIAQIGTTIDVYRRPNSTYVADFVGEACRFRGTVEAVGRVLSVETELGLLELEAPLNPPMVGDVGWIAVRPEHIRLSAPAGENLVRVKAKVKETVFFGARWEVRLTIGETSVIASMTDPNFVGPASGSEIEVGIPREALLWLPR